MERLNAEQIPQVGLDFMNHDHAEASQQINRLDQLIQQSLDGQTQSQQEIEPLLIKIYAHTQAHFAREEAEMVRVNFPAYSCHSGEHQRLLNELTEVLRQWQHDSNLQQLASYLDTTLCSWLINHISTMDSVTAMFIGRFDHSST